MRWIVKLIAGAVATAVAVWLVPGITLEAADRTEQIWILLAVAAILGIVNAFIKPVVQVVGFCLIVLTLGIFLLVINALMLLLTSWAAGQLGLGFHVAGFWPALWGSIIISVVMAIIDGLFAPKKS